MSEIFISSKEIYKMIMGFIREIMKIKEGKNKKHKLDRKKSQDLQSAAALR